MTSVVFLDKIQLTEYKKWLVENIEPADNGYIWKGVTEKWAIDTRPFLSFTDDKTKIFIYFEQEKDAVRFKLRFG